MYRASDLRKMTIQQLDPIAREHGITRTHSFRKSELLNRLIMKLEEKDELEPEPEVRSEPSRGTQHSSFQDSVRDMRERMHESDFEAVSLPPEPHPVSEENAQMMRAFSERSSASLKKTEASVAKVAAAQQQFMPQLYSTRSRANDLAYLPDAQSDITEDSFVLDMIDPYWLHATWCLRRKTVERAKAGMGQYWYSAKPMLRINILNDGDAGTGGRFQHLRDVLIHGHVNHWFLPVMDPPATFVVELGYFCPIQKKFYGLLKSNVISTPQVRSALRYEKSSEVAWMTVCSLQPAKIPSWSPKNHNLYKRWSDKASKTLAADSSTLKVEAPEVTQEEFPLRVTTEMVLYGSTTPDSQVTMNSEWVAVQPDGTFMMRINVPEQGRQMITIDSVNHKESRNMVLTVERTTHMLSPQDGENPEVR